MAYNIEQKPGETIEHYYKRLAKVADQRLRRLEDLQGVEGYENAWKWAYKNAQRDIEKWGGRSEKGRFDTAAPSDPRQLRAKINDIKAFLGSKTSTKQGITQVYKKRAATWNEKYKTNVTWEDLAKYYSKGINEKMERDFASDTVNKAIAVIRSNMTGPNKKTLEDLQHLARMRNTAEGEFKFQFAYQKAGGDPGEYDIIVDQAVHKILRSRAKVEDLYMFLQR